MAYIVMAYIVMAHIVMAYIVMACVPEVVSWRTVLAEPAAFAARRAVAAAARLALYLLALPARNALEVLHVPAVDLPMQNEDQSAGHKGHNYVGP